MPLTTAGRNLIVDALYGVAYTPFDSNDAFIGVGNSALPESQAHTDLQGGSKLRKAMDAGYPTRSTNQLTFVATFLSTEAVFDWQEVGIFNAASNGTMLNRKLAALGSKPNTELWRLTVTVSVVAA